MEFSKPYPLSAVNMMVKKSLPKKKKKHIVGDQYTSLTKVCEPT